MNAQDIANQLLSGITVLRTSVNDARTAYDRRHLKQQTLWSVVELAHLQAVSLFEDFLESLFMACILNESELIDSSPTLDMGNLEIAEAVIYGSGARRQKFLSWLPYGETLDRANYYLDGGRPFNRLKYRQIELQAIKEAVIVRNAVAHSSGHAGSRVDKTFGTEKLPSPSAC